MKVCFFLLFISFTTLANTPPKRILNQDLTDSLAKLENINQQAAQRHATSKKFANFNPQQWNHYQDSVFEAHSFILQKIFSTYGYPGYDLVGREGSNNYWRMVQHCDKQPYFQIKVLKAMKKEVKNNNADPKNYAFLLDRVNLNTGKKQIYGTQVLYRTDSCQAYPKPLADSLRVNQRRAKFGLEPIEQYLNDLSDIHFMMNSKVYEKKGIHQAKYYPVKAR